MNLAKFKPSSENRRILRKGAGIDVKLVPRDKFDYTPERRQFFKTYADIKFGKDVMTFERLDALFGSPIISHLLVFTDLETEKEIGVATLYLEGKSLAFYYYAFYDLNYYARNLGMFMMTSAVALFAERSCKNLYLGTCYSDNALYKTQFMPARNFFNGFPLVGRPGRTEIHFPARLKGSVPAPARNGGIPRKVLRRRSGKNDGRERISGEGEIVEIKSYECRPTRMGNRTLVLDNPRWKLCRFHNRTARGVCFRVLFRKLSL